ncbi:MAG: hypothetical protein CM15mP40_11880 [Alphaproteobacteria bacterium]|nr:MAG: hypothetical protein CM15mP40_11880 [Alphaproteobacteria bacterium]
MSLFELSELRCERCLKFEVYLKPNVFYMTKRLPSTRVLNKLKLSSLSFKRNIINKNDEFMFTFT